MTKGAERKPKSGRPIILTAIGKSRISSLARKNNYWTSK